MDIDGSTKNYGEYLDRTAKLYKIELLRQFKENGIMITPEQWVILSKLYKNDGLSQSEIGEQSYKDAPTVSRIIDILCKKNFAKREPFQGDRRRFQIFLTDEGRVVVEKAIPIIQQTRERGWNGINDEDYNTLHRILNQITQNFESKN